ncbi:MAG: EVE domain-containing protein [Aquificaceae bacterium]|jgi:predicted RNA-binding protein with PUA-like domain|uniref:EVE domain-containing protein n=1 Tax=Hydrogenobacter sp. Uz 6-8 TaxID=3384828 RepID=UPI000F28043B|nr:MAG: EVE domain-containing protein [Aquificota bacterium]
MYYLLKTEPSEYSYEHLLREGRTRWDGVRNPLAQKHMSSMKKGDACFIYHTGNTRAVVGFAKVICEAYKDGDGLWVVDIEPAGMLKNPVPLSLLKAEPVFRDSPLIRMPRLSVIPLTELQAQRIMELSEGLE